MIKIYDSLMEFRVQQDRLSNLKKIMKYKTATITVSGKCYGTTEKREISFPFGRRRILKT